LEDWDAVALHVKGEVKFPRRKLRHIDFSNGDSLTRTEQKVDEQLVNNLRMYPEHVDAARRFFDILDQNDDELLQEPEFLNAVGSTEPAAPAAPPWVLREAGEEIFHDFAPEGCMDFPNFCRFLIVMTYDKPSDFKWKIEDLEVLRSNQLGAMQNESKAGLMNTFVVFDRDSNGNVTKSEFEDTYMGKLYWDLRYKGKLARILDTDQEYEHATTRFDRYTRGTGVLGFPEFVRLVDKAAEKRPPTPVGGGEGCLSCKITKPLFAKSVAGHRNLLCTLNVLFIALQVAA